MPQRITVNIFSSLAVKPARLILAVLFWLSGSLSVLASTQQTLSGAELREQTISYLEKMGYRSAPAINPDRLFRACDQPLIFTPLFGSFQTVEISCPDADGWQIAVRTRTEQPQKPGPASPEPQTDMRHQPASAYVIVTQSLKKGAVITSDDIEIIIGPTDGFDDYFARTDDLLGRRLRKPVSIGRMVRASYLEPDWMIEKGQPVILESRVGTVQVMSEAVALENAQWGDLARFLNVRSDREVFATVISEKKVVTGAKRF